MFLNAKGRGGNAEGRGDWPILLFFSLCLEAGVGIIPRFHYIEFF